MHRRTAVVAHSLHLRPPGRPRLYVVLTVSKVYNGAVIKASRERDVGSTQRPRVLLADDHPATLTLTADALAGEYLVVGSVGDGRELLAEAERLRPDVIVLDITMPRLDGIEAARQLRRSERPARLVFLTVHEDADYARAALDAGGLGFVVKSRLASDLLPAIQEALANRSFISPTIRLDETRLTSPDLKEKPTPTSRKP
jgi:DNA-binding NarL/FixJ family response regulator